MDFEGAQTNRQRKESEALDFELVAEVGETAMAEVVSLTEYWDREIYGEEGPPAPFVRGQEWTLSDDVRLKAQTGRTRRAKEPWEH